MNDSKRFAKTLASRDFHGRGYQNDGHGIAATYIAELFEEWGLEPINNEKGPDGYFQHFNFGLNRIDDGSLELSGTKMKIGSDFIIHKQSGGEFAEGRILDYGYGMPNEVKFAEDRIVVIREGFSKKVNKKEELKKKYAKYGNEMAKIDLAAKNKAAGVILLRKKLTYGLSPMPVEIPVVEMLAESYPKKKKLRKEAIINVSRKMVNQQSQNVMGWVKGTEVPDSFIMVCAHYDHLGRQGDAIFVGGNDNASGTAMMMTMAKHYTAQGNAPRYSMVFVGFGAEEAGLIGSRHYVKKDPIFPLDKIRFVLNVDLMSNGDEGITAVAGLTPERDSTAEFRALIDLNTKMEATPRVKGRTNAPNSDHYYFSEEGVPAMFIYTMGGPPHYHDIYDTFAEMKFSRYYEVRELLMKLVEEIMN